MPGSRNKSRGTLRRKISEKCKFFLFEVTREFVKEGGAQRKRKRARQTNSKKISLEILVRGAVQRIFYRMKSMIILLLSDSEVFQPTSVIPLKIAE
ncbi:hypothetical protein B9Z55_009191 [Caenorhabditis nigoni]|uniref:Uncharacterized protein n=1 Tax=Caenorhabditis nigoni TaxID=1611254 RepID=A0A2G5UQW4_9PELO|nr:hypothetical protein B9Z55_009191 [Caenorhabditis nigoni]